MPMRRVTVQRMLRDPSHPQHGKAGGYTNYGCRCSRCTVAHREAKQAWNEKRRTK